MGNDRRGNGEQAICDRDADHHVQVPVALGQDQHLRVAVFYQKEVQMIADVYIFALGTCEAADPFYAKFCGDRVPYLERCSHEQPRVSGDDVPGVKRADVHRELDRPDVVVVKFGRRAQCGCRGGDGQTISLPMG